MNIYVRELGTQKIISTIDVTGRNARACERVTNGLLYNMNTERYYVDDSECDVLYREEQKMSKYKEPWHTPEGDDTHVFDNYDNYAIGRFGYKALSTRAVACVNLLANLTDDELASLTPERLALLVRANHDVPDEDLEEALEYGGVMALVEDMFD